MTNTKTTTTTTKQEGGRGGGGGGGEEEEEKNRRMGTITTTTPDNEITITESNKINGRDNNTDFGNVVTTRTSAPTLYD